MSSYIIKAQDIVTELMVSLDFDKGGQIAKNLFGLYLYMNRRLIEANIQKDTGILDEVKKLLTELRAAWIDGLPEDPERRRQGRGRIHQHRRLTHP